MIPPFETYFNYEVWNKPDNGPLTVLERGPEGQSCFNDKEEALEWARNKKKIYPHMDFWVREEKVTGYSSQSREMKIVFKTEQGDESP